MGGHRLQLQPEETISDDQSTRIPNEMKRVIVLGMNLLVIKANLDELTEA